MRAILVCVLLGGGGLGGELDVQVDGVHFVILGYMQLCRQYMYMQHGIQCTHVYTLYTSTMYTLYIYMYMYVVQAQLVDRY